jgi:hypothetical protein
MYSMYVLFPPKNNLDTRTGVVLQGKNFFPKNKIEILILLHSFPLDVQH